MNDSDLPKVTWEEYKNKPYPRGCFAIVDDDGKIDCIVGIHFPLLLPEVPDPLEGIDFDSMEDPGDITFDW